MTPPSPPTTAASEPVRAIRLAWRAAARGFVEFYNSDNLTFASSIAYYSLLSFFPFFVLMLSLVSRLAMGGDDQAVAILVERSLPRSFEKLVDQISLMAATPLKLSLVGTVVTLWASMGVFGAVTSAVNHAWGVEKNYGFFKHKLVAFLMLMAAGGLLIVALFLMAAIQVAETSWFAGLLQTYPALQDLQSFAVRNAPTPMFILVVGFIYYFVPNAQVRLRDVWFGAVLAGVLWRVAFSGFAWYVRDPSRLSIHGSIAIGVAFLLWVYVQAVILLYGVEVTAAYARLRKHLPQAAPAAPVREG
ncbi:MAG TPA: YihY/virulence factor BrkB family protein [Vicinamibacterales bacterium]|nr:YihY/virulence factor BrkB family protein [Vicinamibacterales bacterium]